MRIFRVAILLAVVAALLYTINNAADQIRDLDLNLATIDLPKLVLSVFFYIAAMTLSCLFWRKILIAFRCSAPWPRVMLAFFLSQLGKYIPGKALVVVIRTDLIRREKEDVIPAAASVFVETLTWIFVGSVLASILIFFRWGDQIALATTAALMTLIAGIMTLPPVFRRIASTVSKSDPQLFTGLDYPTMIFGWVVMTIAWCCNAASLWLVVASLPDVSIEWKDFPLALACVSLATVAGFASLLPGGVGVRELVMIPLLGTRFGAAVAIVAAILIRLVWLSAELLSSGIIYLATRSKL